MEAHHQSSLRSLQKKRTTNFREDETKLLIQLWGSPQIQNKLYLTHRKEPVMRILAANMQHRGFYRTPDEIKTRIRNLKCLYHRIKRSLHSGAGIGTVDPDWPHYRMMDAILSQQGSGAGANGQQKKQRDLYKESVFEGPRCEDIKQEIDDDDDDEIDINDDMESLYTETNSLGGSEYDDEQSTTLMPPLMPAPLPSTENKKIPTTNTTVVQQPQKTITGAILPQITTIPIQQNHQLTNNNHQHLKATNMPSIPFPLLILNGLQTQSSQEKKDVAKDLAQSQKNAVDINVVLKELLDVQKENLDIEKQRLELEKQRLEFERFVGSQLLAMGPVFGTVFQKLSLFNNKEGDEDDKTTATNDDDDSTTTTTTTKSGRKRKSGSNVNNNIDMFRESKILRSLLDEGIKKFMLDQQEENDNDDDNNSENEDDSGIQNDENSSSSTKIST